MKNNLQDVQPFVWGGIAVTVPAVWETGELGNGYALLEKGFRPALEMKTAAIRGRFSFRRHLKQLARAGRRGSAIRLEVVPAPPGWNVLPAAARFQTFTWQGAQMGGRGLIVFCRTCRRATLMQFYDGALAEAPRVLASFRDHDRPSEPTFAVYDIQAALPERFELTSFHFETGRFSLVFTRSNEIMTLWRWSPADVILAGCDGKVAELARKSGLLPAALPSAGAQRMDNHAQWHWPSERSRKGLRNRFRRRPADAIEALRIWHQPETNRILAVRAERLQDLATFQRTCRSYGVIQKAKPSADPG